MRLLSTAAIKEINKVATDSVTMALLEIQLADPIKLAANNEDILWDGDTWQAFPFEIDKVTEPGKSEIPSTVVKVCNLTGEVQEALEAANGAGGTPVIIRVINTAVSGSTPELELKFILDHASYDEEWVSFHLIGGVCLTRRVPRWRYLQGFCRFAENYGGIECGVSAATKTTFPSCDGTWEQCVARSNSTRFGGFRSMPKS